MSKDKKVKYFQVTPGVWGMKLVFVNIFMIANRKGFPKGWVLVDAGIKGSADKIIAMAESIFGKGTQPTAIVLTHGHIDHVGALGELLEHWNVPVYAHELELPYLTGKSAYPPPDPTVGGGVMSLASLMFRREPLDLGSRVKVINMEEGIPELPGWQFIHTPGHAPGHISLFNPFNATLIAGDAFTTTKAESAIYVLNYFKKLSGPPMYFTTDWVAAEDSVKKLAALEPRIAATGHGPVMRGRELTLALNYLASNFEREAMPSGGRYVDHPIIADKEGTKYVPPFGVTHKFKAFALLVGAAAGFMAIRQVQKVLS
jgi:glyoxylase-like metal-dependent hydrolase (beta-lactamase superfamily II)